MAESDEPQPRPEEPTELVSDVQPVRKQIQITDPSENSPGETVVTSASGSQPTEPSAADSTDTADAPEDPKTAEAVDDITKQEGDEALKAQDEAAETVVMKQSRWERLKNRLAGWWDDPRKRYGTIAGIVFVIAVLFAVPITRYNIVGLFLKAPVTVQVVDSKNGEAVSGATVKLAGQTAQTDAQGKAVLHVHAGSKSLDTSKKYYQGYTHGELITLSGGHNHFKASVRALGRQVKIKVVNKLTGKPVSGAVVAAQGAKAKTDKNGMATVVIAADSNTQAADVSLNGFNTAKVNIIADGNTAKNTFSITPAGKLYFLSNLSGKLDVVKTNLDGTDRQTVLAGTGNEDPRNTSLLASRDWKYLALLSKRAGDNASVYLIDTTDGDKLTTIDQGNANFSFVGWAGDHFVYQVTRNTVSDWQPNQQALKSLDATTGQTLLLDQTQGGGDNTSSYYKQIFSSPYIIGNQIVYGKSWVAAGSGTITDKQGELDTIGADGTGHKTLKTFPYASAQTNYYSTISVNTRLYEPAGIYIEVDNNGDNRAFYDYDNGKVTADASMTDDRYYNTPYPTYLLSPSGSQTFWADQRDGKNTLFTGDDDAKNQKQIATLSDYSTYGWFTDNYLLVSKNSSELYIMPSGGGTPFKITDYYKPAINYQGYGGGYGGL